MALAFTAAPIYSKSQLPASAAAALPSGFDDDRELVESIDAYQVRAGDVCGIVPVVSSSALRAVRASSGCHHEAAFVEEFDDTGKWKITNPKYRPAAVGAGGGREARATGPAPQLRGIFVVVCFWPTKQIGK